ncbi:MAG TPA: antibiotic biosynthesis monooxygenase [Gemmatimonadaceae bacterium]|nr:antibiotic biosynthesis monooxygenase [Gemmatimonadaceae bacterium]
MFVRVWRVRPKHGFEEEFDAVYGGTGAWVQLFRLGKGYLGTEVERVRDAPPEYRTIDRWESRAAWQAFLRQHQALYESLDERGARVTDLEQLVAETEVLPRVE